MNVTKGSARKGPRLPLVTKPAYGFVPGKKAYVFFPGFWRFQRFRFSQRFFRLMPRISAICSSEWSFCSRAMACLVYSSMETRSQAPHEASASEDSLAGK